ncbi:c-type cytochrome [Nitrospira defluvii]|uniref:Cytochrome c domain-containing protein n=1 Tax=Nitrospira defluvii TaxID=330214 RepID=A0ABM8R9B1_9BACT|nr:cytochrome c [Nitrospira defluvii]CAE6740367.1 Cytochrome c domain-containing protein [Nitrospira defluvii]
MRKKLGIIIAVLTVVLANSWVAAQVGPGHPDRGEALYKEHCLRCHGRMGEGDGPDAQGLIVRPVDFHTARSRAKTDFELLIAISNGVLFSPMHSWRGRIADEDMVHVIAYVRALAPEYPHL